MSCFRNKIIKEAISKLRKCVDELILIQHLQWESDFLRYYTQDLETPLRNRKKMERVNFLITIRMKAIHKLEALEETK